MSSRRSHRNIGREIQAALADPSLREALGRAMMTMHQRRAAAWSSESDFEKLREKARAIKDEALERHDELLDLFVAKASEAGAAVFRAPDARAACDYVCELARSRSINLVVKSKSMTSEEIHLNSALEGQGISVIEGDLGERIIQLAKERPSHLVVPAIHKSKEAIIRLLAEKTGCTELPTDAEGLTRLVRRDLRQTFQSAGMGITGANFAIAETGTIVIVENEGNACLTSLLPPIHVAIIGQEKLIPRLADLAVFLELLPRCATGQRLTSYVSLITGRQSYGPPGQVSAISRECHLVLVDNGRSAALADPELRELLRCIRCGACLNTCAPYSIVGGHVFGGNPYPGGIGCAWTYVTKSHSEAKDFNGLCTTCSRCTEVCPVRIDIPWLNTIVRERNNKEFGAGIRQKVFARTDLLAMTMSRTAPLSNAVMRLAPAHAALSLLKIDPSRKTPPYARETLRDWWKRRSMDRLRYPGAPARAPAPPPDGSGAELTGRLALFVDCFTNHNLPQVGKAVVAVCEAAGLEITLAHNSCCGRAALSQGLLDRPREWAARNLAELGRLVKEGYDIVFVEPSCLSAVRDDYTRLCDSTPLDNQVLALVQKHSYDITEYLVMLYRAGRLDLEPAPLPCVYIVHGHCHQKSLGIRSYPALLLSLIPGATIREVETLCCGLVGSFGYKREYSALSQAIGEPLFSEIKRHEGQVVTCGISCRSQIEAGTGRPVLHPVEVLAGALKQAT